MIHLWKETEHLWSYPIAMMVEVSNQMFQTPASADDGRLELSLKRTAFATIIFNKERLSG